MNRNKSNVFFLGIPVAHFVYPWVQHFSAASQSSISKVYDLCKRKSFHGILIRNNFSECVSWWIKFGEEAGVLEKAKRFFISGILKAFNSFREYSMCTLNVLGEGCYIQPSSNIADHAVVLLSIYRRGHMTNTHVIALSMQLPHETSSATTRIVSLFTHCCYLQPLAFIGCLTDERTNVQILVVTRSLTWAAFPQTCIQSQLFKVLWQQGKFSAG